MDRSVFNVTGVSWSLRCGILWSVLLCLTSPQIVQAQLPEGPWKVTKVENGITVKRLERVDNPLPLFLAYGVIKADLYDILAVFDDVAQHTVWVHGCVEARELRKDSLYDRMVYYRTALPWPFKDRDAVVRVRATLDRDAQTARIQYQPPRNFAYSKNADYVRMPQLQGHYELRQVADNETQVTYFVDVHPGGWIPDWLVKIASRELPYRTLLGLRKQTKMAREENRYPDFRQFIDQVR